MSARARAERAGSTGANGPVRAPTGLLAFSFIPYPSEGLGFVATFVRCTASIAAPFPEAKARFLDGPDAWLGSEVGMVLPGQTELDVPLTAGTWPMRKRVTLRMGVVNDSDNAVTLPFRLEATGPKGLFPELDADLTILPVGPDRSQLVIQGSYRPPLDGFGQTLDRVALHRIAEASLQDLAARLAAKLGT